MTALEATFWISIGLVGYVYVGYPAIVVALAWLRARPLRRAPVTPTMTVVIAAHNEERHIAAKLANCLALSYPPERLDVIVVSDGSTDRTPAIVQEYAIRFPRRVTLIALPARRGKATALNTGVAQASGEIVLLADARQPFDAEVARALAENFADPKVGAVSGELMLATEVGDHRGAGLGMYWRYEKAIRLAESRIGSSMGYTGSISAVRRSLYWDLPEHTLLDDLVVALRVIARGYRVVFEPAAKAFDSVSTVSGHEFARKVRTLAGVLQTCVNASELAGGSLGFRAWWQLLSHKALRLAVPYALVTALTASALLAGRVYRVAFGVQVAAYGLAALGLATSARGRWWRIVGVPSAFVTLNVAAVVGAFRYIGGGRLDLWLPASTMRRGAVAAAPDSHADGPGAAYDTLCDMDPRCVLPSLEARLVPTAGSEDSVRPSKHREPT